MYMGGGFGWFSFFTKFLFWVLFILLIIWLFKRIFKGSNQKSEANLNSSVKSIESVLDPIEILRERFARGEITKREFEEKRKLLER